MTSSSRIGTALVWASRRGSALRAIALVGTAATAITWLLGRLSHQAAFESCLGMVLVYVLGTWLQKH